MTFDKNLHIYSPDPGDVRDVRYPGRAVREDLQQPGGDRGPGVRVRLQRCRPTAVQRPGQVVQPGRLQVRPLLCSAAVLQCCAGVSAGTPRPGKIASCR